MTEKAREEIICGSRCVYARHDSSLLFLHQEIDFLLKSLRNTRGGLMCPLDDYDGISRVSRRRTSLLFACLRLISHRKSHFLLSFSSQSWTVALESSCQHGLSCTRRTSITILQAEEQVNKWRRQRQEKRKKIIRDYIRVHSLSTVNGCLSKSGNRA